MLRINLLPGYVAQRRITQKLIFGFAALFILCAVLPLIYYASAKGTLSQTLSQAEDAEAKQKIVQGLKAQADSTRAQIAPI